MRVNFRQFLGYDDTYSLRGIAMLMIIISHTHNGYPVEETGFFFPHWLNYLCIELWGAMGVGIFFFLSGYGLFLALDKRQGAITQEYVLSKVSRLLEPYIIYWVVEIITLLLIDRNQLSLHLFRELITFSIHPDIENWFFKTIVPAYIVIFSLFKSGIGHKGKILSLFVICLAYILIMRMAGFGLWWYNTILCFPLGAFVAYNKGFFENLHPLIVCPLCVILILVLHFIHFNSIVFNILFVFFSIYSIRIININNRLLYFIGLNSFLFYFIECPVMDEIVMFSYANYPLYCMLSVLGTFIISWICLKCVRMIKIRPQEHR